MKHKTLLFTLILLLAMCFSVVNTTTNAGIKSFSAANSYYEVKAGQTFSLKINGVKAKNLKWTSSQSSCVKVNKNSKFKALKNGTSILSAKYKGIKYTVVVFVCDEPMESSQLRLKYNTTKTELDKTKDSLESYQQWYKDNLFKSIMYDTLSEQNDKYAKDISELSLKTLDYDTYKNGYEEYKTKVEELEKENKKLKEENETIKKSLPPVVTKTDINKLIATNDYLDVYFDRIQDGVIYLRYECKNTDKITVRLDFVKINGTTYYDVPLGDSVFENAPYDFKLKVWNTEANQVDYRFSSGTFSGKGHYTDKNYETVYFDFDTTIE